MASGEKFLMPGLVVVGSYNTDLIIWCHRFPTKGETLTGGNSEMFSGGRGANCAVAAARAGCEVVFVGAMPERKCATPAENWVPEREGFRPCCVVKVSEGERAVLFGTTSWISHGSLVSFTLELSL